MRRVLVFVLAAAVLAGGYAAWRASRGSWVESRLSVRDFVSGLSSVQPDLKLVVAKVELVKTMEGESAKSVLGLDLGTTKASLSVPARVHYAVDLTAPEPVSWRYDRASRLLVAEFAAPEGRGDGRGAREGASGPRPGHRGVPPPRRPPARAGRRRGRGGALSRRGRRATRGPGLGPCSPGTPGSAGRPFPEG